MTDILAGVNLMIGVGWFAIGLMVIAHLVLKMRFNSQQERAALWRLLVIAVFMAWEKITISILATPSNLENAANLPAWIYVVAIGGRVGSLLTVWELVRWVWFTYWPSLNKESKDV